MLALPPFQRRVPQAGEFGDDGVDFAVQAGFGNYAGFCAEGIHRFMRPNEFAVMPLILRIPKRDGV
jgi:hypothetical protein